MKNDLQNQLQEEPAHDSSEKPVDEATTQAIINSSKGSLAAPRDPFFNRKPSPKEIEWDWLPDGPWRTNEGKLDAAFLWAIAQRWLKEHGGDIHAKRANVLKHFRNEPTNLPIEWEWYQNLTLHKASNIQIRKQAEIDTTVDEQEIIKHFSAAKELPEELRVTEEREPKEVLEEIAPHILKAIEAPSDEFGQINPGSYQLKEFSADDRAFWQKIYSPQLNQATQSTNSSAKKEAEEAMDSVDDQKKVAKKLIENLRRRHEEKRKRPLENQGEGDKNLASISKVINPPAEIPFSVILEDMRKYLNCGSDIYRQRAIDWACNPENGCKLVRSRSGWIVDIEEIDF
ncbi:hypothetical protein [Scytonema sp. PCC 10023]|uniref:hypothetical protein n=1 Tax=Scytonema sp. PCC 10023 TaxID=1680591 RepID=UPI0039C6FE31